MLLDLMLPDIDGIELMMSGIEGSLARQFHRGCRSFERCNSQRNTGNSEGGDSLSPFEHDSRTAADARGAALESAPGLPVTPAGEFGGAARARPAPLRSCENVTMQMQARVATPSTSPAPPPSQPCWETGRTVRHHQGGGSCPTERPRSNEVQRSWTQWKGAFGDDQEGAL